ncbi:MAG: hypothetical protein Kow0089_19920 [Desulfobulbaceae bacterium]
MSVDRKNLRYYSQHGEDCLLWEFFDFKQKGFFIEVGAFDGRYLSNTYSFEEQGWTGLCVEPHPRFFAACRENRPGSVCVNVACVGDETKEVVLKVDPAGLYSGLADDPERNEYVRAIFENSEQEFESFTDVPVPAATLDELLERYFPDLEGIDFVSIDVEGTETDVLRGFNLERYAPEVIVIEANSGEARKEITEYLVSRGYHYARMTGVNLVFVRSGEALRKIQDIIIRCRIEKQEHPLDSAYSVKGIAEGLHVDDFAALRQKVKKLRERISEQREELRRLEEEKRNLAREKNSLERAFNALQAKHDAIMNHPLMRMAMGARHAWKRLRGEK